MRAYRGPGGWYLRADGGWLPDDGWPRDNAGGEEIGGPAGPRALGPFPRRPEAVSRQGRTSPGGGGVATTIFACEGRAVATGHEERVPAPCASPGVAHRRETLGRYPGRGALPPGGRAPLWGTGDPPGTLEGEMPGEAGGEGPGGWGFRLVPGRGWIGQARLAAEGVTSGLYGRASEGARWLVAMAPALASTRGLRRAGLLPPGLARARVAAEALARAWEDRLG